MDMGKAETVDRFFMHDSQTFLDILTWKRHLLLNHLQIALGYLSLGKEEQAKESLYGLVEHFKQEHLLSRLGDPDLVIFLYRYPLLYPNIQFEVEISESVSLPRSFNERKGGEQIRDLLQWIGKNYRQNCEEECSLMLRFEKGLNDLPLITIDLFCPPIGGDQIEEYEKVKGSLEKGFNVEEMGKNEREWVLSLNWKEN
ncbi:MAG: Spo0B domain-containing protein [Thermicanus sp.]|nr:Spo0B domain-containing protein [Thermicanus sp.]